MDLLGILATGAAVLSAVVAVLQAASARRSSKEADKAQSEANRIQAAMLGLLEERDQEARKRQGRAKLVPRLERTENADRRTVVVENLGPGVAKNIEIFLTPKEHRPNHYTTEPVEQPYPELREGLKIRFHVSVPPMDQHRLSPIRIRWEHEDGTQDSIEQNL